MRRDATHTWTPDEIHALIRGYQGAAVLAAAAELELFPALGQGPMTARALSERIGCDLRALSALLDALAAVRLLVKRGGRYSLSPGVADVLTHGGGHSGLSMAQHQANCMRNWAQLARVVKAGRPAERTPSVRGAKGDREAFIGAMDNTSAPVADSVVRRVRPLRFSRLLDIGGASGTWTLAFLRACPTATAVLFDLPAVIPMAASRVAAAGMSGRVRLVPGDFTADPLPDGADLAWVSAIVHQNSREQNRGLFAKVFSALVPGGRIAIRDMVMDEARTRPLAGALFAVNMLVATEGGGTFTFRELRRDLEAAGFDRAVVAHRDPGMNSVVVARKPGGTSKGAARRR
ncbi:MAG: methyltransferase [Opitutaceae bacterium]|jgi:precorrin-6B methylase 2